MLSSQTRTYRAHLIPAGVLPENIETLAAVGGLESINLKSTDGASAMVAAHKESGLPVHSIERIEA
ncbi:hypothetical protein [Xylophilus sp. Leaf220]|uniref:hypothetical protein n=1 Tax=Xylophilus sp. Leaf220 TaxID=1735686 RepID=UPI000701F9F5|nr:hypothetical protein [Xylophilus sp. Leaf220]KQM68793.1 hypothetical protein ASE76_13935 [Xylophilus sp. Leaf220]